MVSLDQLISGSPGRQFRRPGVLRPNCRGVVVVCLLLIGACSDAPLPDVRIENLHVLQSGDIVFFEGRRWRSAAVKALEPGPGAMTHLGIIVRDSHKINLVHASPYKRGRFAAGVRREPLGAFLRRERPAMSAYRCSIDSLRTKAAHWAIARAREAAPFDSRFDATSDSAFYCTEFVWKAYREFGLDLAESMFDTLRHPFGRLTVLFPRGLARSPHLKRISIDMSHAESASLHARQFSQTCR